jgi:hypothetical protein
MRPSRLAGLAVVCVSAFVAGGCSMWGFGDEEPETTATTARPAITSPSAPSTEPSTPSAATTELPSDSTAVASATVVASAEPKEGEVDVRRYLGPNYCPELRVVNGAELMRQYERGHEEDAKYVIWQASVGKTARECLWDLQGGLTLKVGVSGRLISGPKGGAATIPVPIKIAVVKNKEAVLATERFTVDTAIPATGSGVFTQVKDILVPSPGQDRDYIVFVGLDVGDWDELSGTIAPVAVVEEPPPLPPLEEPPPAPAEPTTPKELPVPDDGFVLQ